MKQKVLLLLVLAFGMCSTNTSAQTKKTVRNNNTQKTTKPIPKDSREYQVGDDGFEWYKVCKNGKYGVEDRNGGIIVPVEYEGVWYFAFEAIDRESPVCKGFVVKRNGGVGWFNKSGKCVIPYTRGYTGICKYDSEKFGTYYGCVKPNLGVICDKSGRECISVKADSIDGIQLKCWNEIGNEYYVVELYRIKEGIAYYRFADATGNIIVKQGYKYDIARKLASEHITTTTNPFARNKHETLAEVEDLSTEDNNISSLNSSSSSSNSSSSNINSSGGTTTIVVEHHHDPTPVQEWQQCPACFGSGQCPNVQCGGSGWYYIGDRRSLCTRCHGSGKCTICAGRGGQNVTVYR